MKNIQYILLFVFGLTLMACQKEVIRPNNSPADYNVEQMDAMQIDQDSDVVKDKGSEDIDAKGNGDGGTDSNNPNGDTNDGDDDEVIVDPNDEEDRSKKKRQQ